MDAKQRNVRLASLAIEAKFLVNAPLDVKLNTEILIRI